MTRTEGIAAVTPALICANSPNKPQLNTSHEAAPETGQKNGWDAVKREGGEKETTKEGGVASGRHAYLVQNSTLTVRFGIAGDGEGEGEGDDEAVCSALLSSIRSRDL